MHDVDLILTLAGGLSAALVFGAITHRLRLSPIVGYLIAGIVVGPVGVAQVRVARGVAVALRPARETRGRVSCVECRGQACCRVRCSQAAPADPRIRGVADQRVQQDRLDEVVYRTLTGEWPRVIDIFELGQHRLGLGSQGVVDQ